MHLGSRLDASSSDSPDLQRRAALAREMIEPLKRLFRNSELTEAEKVHLLQSMPMARFKHGAGLWALESQKEREKFAAAYYEAPRRLFRAISGMTVRGLSNRDVATILGIATDQEMRNAELLRLAAWIFAEDMPALTALWLREDRWHIGMKIPCFIRPRINCTASSVPIRTVHRRLFAVTCAGARRDAYTKRPSASPNSCFTAGSDGRVCFGRLSPGKVAATQSFACPSCHSLFSTAAACAAHQSKVHSKRARATALANGSLCQVSSGPHVGYVSTSGVHSMS